MKFINMKSRFVILCCSTALILAVTGCYYDKAELLYPAGSCDTVSTVSYTQHVVPILDQASCYSCHKGGSPSGGISMGTYATDKAIASNGKLYGSINHSPGFKPMPENSAKMTSCKIATIKKWIDQGAPNN